MQIVGQQTRFDWTCQECVRGGSVVAEVIHNPDGTQDLETAFNAIIADHARVSPICNWRTGGNGVQEV